MSQVWAPLALSAWISCALAGAGPVLVDVAHGVNRINEGKVEQRADGTLVWSGAYFGVGEPMDWSSYDYVELKLFNPTGDIIPFTFEVKDQDSSSYWTRVNQPQVLGPGLQTVKLPTRLKVGEPARPGRSLETALVRSLILSREDKHREPIEVRSIELKKAEHWPMPPGARAFDVGPEDMPVFDGLEPLTEKMDYMAARGVGWLEKKFWAPYPQVNRLFGPETLTGDNLTIASAKLRIDLKPGIYRVALIIDHPGGFWGEFPYFHHRVVRAQGKAVIDERETMQESESSYFKWEGREDREGDDLFERYWNEILKEKSFGAEVGQGGHLELSFASDGCPPQGCFGIALSFLAVLPYNTPDERAAAAKWLSEVHSRRREEFNDQFKQSTRHLTELLASLPKGLVARDVSPELDLSLARPADARSFSGSHRVTAFRNARAIFAPLVSWKGKTPRTVTWRVEGLPKDLPVEGGWVKFRALRDSYTGNQYSVRERWASDDDQRVFPFEDVGRLWLRFPVSSAAKPGIYPATLVLQAAKDSVRVPFELRVLKGMASDLDFPVGPFYARIQENWWDTGTLRSRLLSLEEKSLEKLSELGMTSFSFSPKIGVTFRGDRAELDTRETDRVMALARKFGFKELVGYDGIFEGASVCAADSMLGDPVRFKRVVDALEERSREDGWLPLSLVICDEPTADNLPKLISKLEAVHLSGPGAKDRRIRWSVTTSLGKTATPLDRKLVSLVSLPFLQGFSKDELRFPWAYYNDPSRQSVGLGMFALRETTDLRLRMIWAWNVNSANPYFSLDSREDDIAWCSSLKSGDLQCTVELDRVYDAGVTDYRIALALKKALSYTADPALKAEGSKLLNEAKGNHVDPDKWRSKVGEFLERL